ncbi:CBS domain-containing protein [Paracoccus sp. M683]|uniref:CBS domain-containing protein n=1 Tax=Paracoccus sp. M683 TaxID=2594268 RepID=UPI00163DB2DD|nr:CBS domain-containing protein [Paracoccus sp. M683]
MTNMKRPQNQIRTVRDIVAAKTHITFKPKDSVPDIIKRMQISDLSAGGVVNSSGKFVGMVTEHEIVRKAFGDSSNLKRRLISLSEKSDAESLTAWDVMIPNANSLDPTTSAEGALDIVTFFGYRRMPVVASDGTFIGIVDAIDIHRHVLAKSQDVMKSKDALLSYFMGVEPYGIGAAI